MNIALEQTEEYVNGQVSLPMDKQCWIIIRIEIKTSEDLSSISHFFTAEEQIRRRIHSRQQCSLHLHSPQAVGWVWHRQLDRDGQLGEKVGKTLDQRHCEWSDTNSWQLEPPPFFRALCDLISMWISEAIQHQAVQDGDGEQGGEERRDGEQGRAAEVVQQEVEG